MIKHVTKDTYEAEVTSSTGTVLVDFWATWCGPCRVMGQVLEELSEEMPEAQIVKIDVDEEPELARQFGIMSIPTFVVFRDGKPVKKMVGGQDKDDLAELFR